MIAVTAGSVTSASDPRDRCPVVFGFLTTAQSEEKLLPEAFRQFEFWTVPAAVDPALDPNVEQGWTRLASMIQAAGAEAAADCSANRDLVSLAKLK
jgi:hypothetical protein